VKAPQADGEHAREFAEALVGSKQSGLVGAQHGLVPFAGWIAHLRSCEASLPKKLIPTQIARRCHGRQTGRIRGGRGRILRAPI
jgi:hypothetical protein